MDRISAGILAVGIVAAAFVLASVSRYERVGNDEILDKLTGRVCAMDFSRFSKEEGEGFLIRGRFIDVCPN